MFQWHFVVCCGGGEDGQLNMNGWKNLYGVENLCCSGGAIWFTFCVLTFNFLLYCRTLQHDEQARHTRNTFRNLHLLFGNHAWICIYLHFYSFHILNHFFSFTFLLFLLRCWERWAEGKCWDVHSFLLQMFHLRIATMFFTFHSLFMTKCVDVELSSIQWSWNKRKNKTEADYTEMSYDDSKTTLSLSSVRTSKSRIMIYFLSARTWLCAWGCHTKTP